MLKRVFLCLGFILILAVPVFAMQPTPEFYVNDYVGVLNQSTASNLVQKAENLYAETGIQVVTIITDFVVGSDEMEYATELYNRFGIGSKKDDLGLLLFVAIEDGAVCIIKGSGVDSYISDSQTGRLLDDYFMDYAMDDDFNNAVNDTFMALIKLANRELADYATVQGSPPMQDYGLDSYTRYQRGKLEIETVILYIAVGLIIFACIAQFARRVRRRGPYHTTHVIYRDGRFESRGHGNRRPPLFSGSNRESSGGGRTLGGGASRSFSGGSTGRSSSSSSSRGSSSSGRSSGGGGRSSGGGASRKF